MSVEKLVWEQIPECLIGKIAGLLEDKDLNNLSLTSKNNKQILELVDEDIFLSSNYSSLYITDDSFRNIINDILKKRNKKLRLTLDSGFKLKTFPDLSSLDELVELNFEFSDFIIPENIADLLPRNLQILTFWECFLSRIPNLSSLHELVELEYSDDFDELENISELLPINLQRLKIGFCDRLKSFPNLNMFEKLVELQLNDNCRMTFPENMVKLLPPNLEKLRICCDVMTAFPDLSSVSKLEDLDITDCNFTLPENLGEFLPPNLKKLKLTPTPSLFNNFNSSTLNKLLETELEFYDEEVSQIIDEKLRTLLKPN
jgi:hypothetical protein